MALETNRLLITAWDPQDWKAFYTVSSDPDVMKYIGKGDPWSAERTEQFVNGQIENFDRLGFCLWKLTDKPTRALIGFCGLQHLDESLEIEIGWWLAKAFWGKGLATEAAMAVLRYGFDTIALERIVAIAQPANRASIRVMEKLGMRHERNTVDRHGMPVVFYSIENRIQGTTGQ
ncbi:MAG TPA: GNAT family N-acetyltransferase [Terriglobia bacterium]|nr:GNAT family N-acetyltransferase [Terriglobia bacterium]